MKTALTTDKVRLRLAVAPIGKTAHRASLAGMPWVNGYDLDAESLSLILKESFELGKTPGMKTPFSLSSSCLDPSADIGEVFNHDSGADRDAFQDRSRKDVVAIPSETLLTPSKASKVSFGTLRAIGLQSLSQSESSFDDFLPVAVSVKEVIRTNSRSGDAKVYADSLPIRSKGHIRQSDNEMQIIPPLVVEQVSSGSRIAPSVVGILRKGEGDVLPAHSGRKVDSIRFPVHFECMKIVAWRAMNRPWRRNLKPLLILTYSRLNRFRSLLTSLNMQVGDKGGISIFTVSVSQPMQSVGVAISLLPAYFTDLIERSRELVNCIFQYFRLFLAGLKSHSYCSIHKSIIPYISVTLQILRKEEGQFLC